MAHGGLHEVRRTLHDRPHAIRVRVDHPRRLAAQLAGMNEITGLRIPTANTLMIETTSPERVYERLPELILAENMTVREIAPADESLEAVFGYLTQRSG